MNNSLSRKIKKRKGKIIYLLAIEIILLILDGYYLFVGNDYVNVVRVTVTFILAMIPMTMELIFNMSIPWPVYCFTVIYACEHTMGSCFNLYLFIPWWDDMMHCTEGFLFAMFGYYYLSFGNEKTIKHRLKYLLFAVSLSVFIAVLWEMTEYGVDNVSKSDMQKDTFVTKINSYLLADNTGEIVTIDNISEVTVDGKVLPGYIDIGLTDTMIDLMTALAGAVVFSIYCLIDRDRHPLLKFEESS